VTQTRWESCFKPARYGRVVDPAESPVREMLDPGDVAAADLLGHEVRHYLSQDEVLRGIFGSRIEFMPWRNTFDFTAFPRLGVYLSSAIDEEAPTSVSIEGTSVYVTTFWDAKHAEPVKDGMPSVATVLAHVKRVLRSDKARTLVVSYQNAERSLSSESVRIEGDRFAPVQMTGRVAFLNELQFTYTLKLDRSGVRLLSLS
jgi:hypothetical protein